MSSNVSGTGGEALQVGAPVSVLSGGPSRGYMLETIEDICAHLQRIPSGDPALARTAIMQRERAHRAGKLTNPLNGEQQIFALLGYDDIRTLEGRLLTIVDATFGDPQQRKAFKDLVRKELWFNWVRYLDTDDENIGIAHSR